ncbi:MAG: cation diffusion facilitator family transporter [Clostridiales bacterium]|jgi:cation diffusion facilitator family transporter|nr:cation diffusion facilitator family transporter [Clostridiales bacterium]
MQENQVKPAVRVSIITIIINAVLTALKLAVGVFAASYALISDAAHSGSDVLSTLIVVAGIKSAGKSADKKHSYGHERFECIAAIVLAAMLFATGAAIGYGAVSNIISGGYKNAAGSFGLIATVTAAVSIAVKELMYRYTMRTAKKISSGALAADAWHHRSDALSSVGSLIAVAGAAIGFPILDPIAGMVICAFVIKAAASIFWDSVKKMTDEACPDGVEAEMRAIILNRERRVTIDSLKTRRFGDKFYADVEIGIDAYLTFVEAHNIATDIHDDLERAFPSLKHCMVHANPRDDSAK